MRNDMQCNRRPMPTYDSFDQQPIAMAYVPWQNWRNVYDLDKGFCRGTIFQELDKPFYGNGGCRS